MRKGQSADGHEWGRLIRSSRLLLRDLRMVHTWTAEIRRLRSSSTGVTSLLRRSGAVTTGLRNSYSLSAALIAALSRSSGIESNSSSVAPK
jgi:hypothetical protein